MKLEKYGKQDIVSLRLDMEGILPYVLCNHT